MNVRQEFEKLHHLFGQKKITQSRLVAGLSRLMMYARTNDSEFFPTIKRALDSATWKGQTESDGRTGATKTIHDREPKWAQKSYGRKLAGDRAFAQALDRQERKSKKNPPYRAMKIGECEVGQTISGAGADWKVEIKKPNGAIVARCLDNDNLREFSAEELQQFTVLPGLMFGRGEIGHHPLSRQTRNRRALSKQYGQHPKMNENLSDAFEIRAVAGEVIQELIQELNEGAPDQHDTPNWLGRVPAEDAVTRSKELRSKGLNPRILYRDKSGQRRYYKGQEMIQGNPRSATRSGWTHKKTATHADLYHRGTMPAFQVDQEVTLNYPEWPIESGRTASGTVVSSSPTEVVIEIGEPGEELQHFEKDGGQWRNIDNPDVPVEITAT